ncbi:MAG TPA: glutamate racemase [Anaerolineae bacterium]|nr:glutamate racemase [Anaerolineae bacterium]
MSLLTPTNGTTLDHPVAVWDSGVGGLSVLRHLRQQLPQENFLYFADQAHVPYGPRPLSEIREFGRGLIHFLQQQQAKALVIACNTASAAALTFLRQQFPQFPIIGMEPAIKPAAQTTQTGHIGVLATTGTFTSERYAQLMARFAPHIQVWEDPCIGLVTAIEAGHINTDDTANLLRAIVTPMLNARVDTIVLGCTHYPFITPLLTKITGPHVTIIDPAPAVARHTAHVLRQHQLLRPVITTTNSPQLTLMTSGATHQLEQVLPFLWGSAERVVAVGWANGRLWTSPPSSIIP